MLQLLYVTLKTKHNEREKKKPSLTHTPIYNAIHFYGPFESKYSKQKQTKNLSSYPDTTSLPHIHSSNSSLQFPALSTPLKPLLGSPITLLSYENQQTSQQHWTLFTIQFLKHSPVLASITTLFGIPFPHQLMLLFC